MKGISVLLGVIAPAAIVSTAPAAQVTYQLLTDASVVNHWPGADGLIGSADDVVDGAATSVGGSGPNTPGALSHVSFDFGIPTDDLKLASGFDAISYIDFGSFVFDAAAGSGSPLVISFDIISGTEPFFGHGPYNAQTSGGVTGSSTGSGFSVAGAPYDTTINGSPDSAVMSFSGTWTVVDPNGAATGDSYLDSVLTPIALANNAQSYVVLSGTGSSGLADNGGFPDMPIQVSLVGFEPIPEPSIPVLSLAALLVASLRRRRP